MNVFITGAGGFLGSGLACEFRRRGHTVRGSAPWRLGEALDPEALRPADLAIHCAYARDASIERNVEGTKAAARAATDAGATRQIFVSSYSARPDATSAYGRIKYALETWFLETGHTVVRPGLVIGGGLFERSMRQILRSPVVPLIGGGKDAIPLIDADDFTAATIAIAESGRTGAYNLFDARLMPLRDLVGAINRAAGHRAIRVSIPVGLAAVLLRLGRGLGVPIAVDEDNLRALIENRKPIHASDLASLLPEHASIEASIERAVMVFMSTNRA